MIEPDAAPAPSAADLGLRSAPFVDCDDDAFFFPSDQHLQALEFLGHSLWTKARMGVVTAERGCGKSLLIRRLLRDLDERVVAAAVQREQLGPRELLLEILHQFGMPLAENDKTDRRKLLERFLTHQAAMNRICVLVVENPQSMSPAALEELRLLAALHVDGARILKLLLLGQPSLDLVLQSPRMAELGAARAPRFLLAPLSEDQTAAYVAHRLRAAGAANPDAVMPSNLMPQIHACSGGAPAQINRLCARALENAAAEGASGVAPAALEQAIEALGLECRKLRVSSEPAPAVHSAADAVQPKLVISIQGRADRDAPLNAPRLLIGRADDADVRIDSVFVSRYHALIVQDHGQHLMIDLGSTNGLIVNSRRVVRRALRHRDLIQIGPARVMYLNERLAPGAQPDLGETVCFARPGFPAPAGEGEAGALLAFGRSESAG